jgi:hypothetical protein
MIIDIVVRGHAFPLTTDDTATISREYEAFFKGGPALDYGVDVTTGSGRPTYEALMAATDQQGHNWSFLQMNRDTKRFGGWHKGILLFSLPVTSPEQQLCDG